MIPVDRIISTFDQSIATLQIAKTSLPEIISDAAGLIVKSLLNGGKLLICGNGGSAADAQHFSSELLNRFEAERPALPAIAITTDASTITSISNDYNFDQIFSRQVMALGNDQDILFAITTSGHSPNVIEAIEAAHEKQMTCIVLNGRDGGSLSTKLKENDINILAPGDSTARIQEVHGIVIHCLCDLIDRSIFGHAD